jgi:antitoxin MazE
MEPPMIKKLTRHGNSLALVIERPILDLLDIDPDTPLEIVTDGKVLMITPVRDKKRRRQFEQALGRANRKYGRMLKRLAE